MENRRNPGKTRQEQSRKTYERPNKTNERVGNKLKTALTNPTDNYGKLKKHLKTTNEIVGKQVHLGR